MALTLEYDVSGLFEATRDMEARIKALQGARLNVQIGRGVANLFRDHLFKLNGQRANALGGKRTNFYSDAAKATHSSGNDSEAVVTISQQGIRQRLLGGTIRPTGGKKYLTIPARAEAYGRRAGEFQDLQFVKLKNGTAMLIAGGGTGLKLNSKGEAVTRKGFEEGLVMFWLVPSVVQRPDRSVLPSDEAIYAAIRGTVQAAWKQAGRGSVGGGGEA